MGLDYKKNIKDRWESPSIKIIGELANLGVGVQVYGPFVPSIRTKARVFDSVESVEEALCGADGVVIMGDHDVFQEISVETEKGLMSSPVVVCMGIGEGVLNV